MDSFEKLRMVVKALASKKGQDITALDLREVSIIADFFVIATGSSSLNIRALVDAVDEAAGNAGIRDTRIEGANAADWVLLDIGDVVVHIFDAEHRDFYQLERLWTHAPRVTIPPEWLT